MNDQTSSQVLEKILHFENQHKASLNHVMDVESQDSTQEELLEILIKNYMSNIQKQQSEIENLSHESNIQDVNTIFSPSASLNLMDQLRRLKALAATCDELSSNPPEMPHPTSLIPAVIALDNLVKTTADSKPTIEFAIDGLEGLEVQLKTTESSFMEAKLLGETLDSRIAKLQSEQEIQTSKFPETLAQEMIGTKQQRIKQLNFEARKTSNILRQFIKQYLASMIAAEELGGPVAGNFTEKNDDILQSGFSAQGHPKTGREIASGSGQQQRIDVIWGNNANRPMTASTAAEAAEKELTKLTDKLVRALHGVSNSGVYVNLERDSAAARFLVRARVAQFHPRDARKLRLVDFGRELDAWF